MTPSPWGRCSTSPTSSTPACASRPSWRPSRCSDACKAVERDLGRDTEGGIRHGPRPIDVDVLLLGDLVHRSPRLTLPHEQATARRFVLIPLLELDFDLRTPDGARLSDGLAALPPDERVVRSGPPLRVSPP
jgi:7,8-dihydro-6-hydroxymethylpterin-pyrophosphokinase